MPTRDPLVEEVITLTGGRKLGYCEHGLADGEPIIFFPGAGFGRRCVPTPFPNLLVDHGVRLIAVDRPGYGLSDLHPGRCYRDWAEDVRQLMEHLKLDKARFLAHSAGTAHLAAVCAFAPELVAGIEFAVPALLLFQPRLGVLLALVFHQTINLMPSTKMLTNSSSSSKNDELTNYS